jgi:hypothetical protein
MTTQVMGTATSTPPVNGRRSHHLVYGGTRQFPPPQATTSATTHYAAGCARTKPAAPPVWPPRGRPTDTILDGPHTCIRDAVAQYPDVRR